MSTSQDARPAAGTGTTGNGSRFRSLAMIAVFDIAGPLAAYHVLRTAGLSTVTALILSGVFPALGLAIRAASHRRLDVVGIVVLAGIVAGAVLGLVSHSARLVLAEASVPTAVFGLACLGSLRARRPLMYSLALEFVGPDTAKGRDMTLFWQHAGFRRSFRVITAGWGVAFLAEAALKIVIVYSTSAGTALTISTITPFLFTGIMLAWTLGYSALQKRKYERAAGAAGQAARAGQPTVSGP